MRRDVKRHRSLGFWLLAAACVVVAVTFFGSFWLQFSAGASRTKGSSRPLAGVLVQYQQSMVFRIASGRIAVTWETLSNVGGNPFGDEGWESSIGLDPEWQSWESPQFVIDQPVMRAELLKVMLPLSWRDLTTRSSYGSEVSLGLGFWLMLAVAATVLCAYRNRTAPDPLACAVCGYDLRASPARCPECGTQHTRDHITPQ